MIPGCSYYSILSQLYVNDSVDIIVCLILISSLELWPVTEENANMTSCFQIHLLVFFYIQCHKTMAWLTNTVFIVYLYTSSTIATWTF